MYWTRLVLVRPAASLYSASPLKHHPTGKQWCPNPDHYSDSESARRSLTLMCWAPSRAAEPQSLTSFVWRGRGSNHQPPACPANAQPQHYPDAVKTLRKLLLKLEATGRNNTQIVFFRIYTLGICPNSMLPVHLMSYENAGVLLSNTWWVPQQYSFERGPMRVVYCSSLWKTYSEI